MVSVDIIRARRVSWTRGMRWTVQHCQNPLQISCRNAPWTTSDTTKANTMNKNRETGG
ncbi:hypothetical protein EV363DRAFT_1169566 [Boletus edulis]|nr:hypothetical protein EV363DRAFT_1169566 [Boletus edulis]